MRLFVLTVLFSAAASFSSVDIAGEWGELYIAWSESPGITYLKDVNSSQPAVEFGQPNPSLGYVIFGLDPLLVLATSSEAPGVPDSLFLIFPCSLNVYSSRSVTSTDFTSLLAPELSETSIQVARHQNEQNAFYLSSDPSVPVSGESENNIISARMACDSPAGIYAKDTLGVCFDAWFTGISGYTRPVCCGTGPAAQFWTISGSYGFSITNHYAGLHELDGTPVPDDYDPMRYEYFYNPGMGSYLPGHIQSVGSCFSEALVFWTTVNDEELLYSVFPAGSSAASISDPAPYSIPQLSPLAMTCNPDDSGLLLVWQQSGEIRCAHWEGEWNQYWHVVETGVADLMNGNLAVCSVEDGYWIAWITYSAESSENLEHLNPRAIPDVRFVSRSTVTSIDGPSEGLLINGITVSPNPVFPGNVLSIHAEQAEGIGQVELRDLNGRIQAASNFDSFGNATIGTDNLQPGTYFVRVSVGNTDLSKKVIVLR